MDLILKLLLWLGLGLGLTECQSLRGANLVVTTILDTPYTMLSNHETNLTGNDRFEGYIVDLIDAASKILDFKYVLVVNDENMYGSKDQTGKWNGMIGDVVNGRAHVAAAALTITYERESVVDFTHPFMNLGISIIHKIAPQEDPSMFTNAVGLLVPFTDLTTNLFLIVALVLGFALLLIHRKHKSFLFRTLLGLWLVILFFFAALFIAQVTAYNVSKQYVEIVAYPFSNVEDIASQSKVAYGCIRGGSTCAFFRDSKNPTYMKIWNRMQSTEPSSFVANNAEGIERVKAGGYAFFMESTGIEYALQRDCALHQVGGLLNSKGFGLAVQPGSSIRDELNTAILKLEESGDLMEMKKKWWMERNGGGNCYISN